MKIRRAVMAIATIEVERKFMIQDLSLLKSRIAENGGVALGEVKFTDKYYDTSECTLTKNDQWLRLRDEEWELKVPTMEETRSGGERTVFREVSGASNVVEELAKLHPTVFDRGDDLPGELDRAGCAVFAEFETTRSKFELDGCQIDSDVASFGHSVLEIEVLVESEEQVAAAERRIEDVARLIEAAPLAGETGGKLETYIRRHAPVVFENLVEAGILNK